MKRIAVLVAALVGCGGCGGKPPAVSPGLKAGQILPGSYPCAFVSDGTAYGPFKCTVAGFHIDKPGGLEPWSGTLTPIQGGVHLAGLRKCTGGGDCSATAPFTVDLQKDPASETYRGKVAGAADWWLSSATLEIRNAGMGGEQYGGAQ